MKKRKSPQLKKQDEYDKDRRPVLEHPHAFRKNWPKKKARANRSERVALRKIASSLGDAEITQSLIKARKRRAQKNRKYQVMTLRERIALNLERRARPMAKLPTDT